MSKLFLNQNFDPFKLKSNIFQILYFSKQFKKKKKNQDFFTFRQLILDIDKRTDAWWDIFMI